MVTIIDYKQMTNGNDEPFNALVLQGEVEMVKSKETGRYYATARKTLIPSTFSDAICQDLIGKEMAGVIKRVPTDPYEYEIPESGEKLILEYTWEYDPEPVTTEENVFENGKNKVAF